MDIGPGDSTAAWFRILANQIENDTAPDFFIVAVSNENRVDSARRDTANVVTLVGAIEIKLQEFKNEIIEAKNP